MSSDDIAAGQRDDLNRWLRSIEAIAENAPMGSKEKISAWPE
jgi:hypothetical protein